MLEPRALDVDETTRGILIGIAMYAWWKDGTQYVGTSGKTLQHAQLDVLRENGYPELADKAAQAHRAWEERTGRTAAA